MIWFRNSNLKKIAVYFAGIVVLTMACCFLFGEMVQDEYDSVCMKACKDQIVVVDRIESTKYLHYLKCDCYYKNNLVGVARQYIKYKYEE